MSEIIRNVLLGTNQLIPNPKNPRKNIGDITELKKSIEKNGIMQNLMVMPVDEEYKEFIVLIGHRRLAAAKEAGILEVPCMVTPTLTEKEQLTIMLEENIQRSDLTILEEAESFQMMMELGETVESLAEKSGFSESTIRHRIKIAELDKENLKKQLNNEDYQLSLTDFYELEKVDDVEVRNKIFASAHDKGDLKRRVNAFLREQKEDKIFKKCKTVFSKFGIKENANISPWDSKYDRIFSAVLNNDNLADDIKKTISNLQDVKSVFYIRSYSFIYIMKKEKKKTLSKEEKKKKELQKNRKSLLQLQRIKQKKRHDFITGTFAKSKLKESDKKYVLEESFRICMEGQGIGLSKNKIASYIQEKNTWEIDETDTDKVLELETHLVMLMLADFNMQINDGTYMAIVEWNSKYIKSKANEIRDVYEIICKYGYEIDDEELQLLNGTHELYNKEEE